VGNAGIAVTELTNSGQTVTAARERTDHGSTVTETFLTGHDYITLTRGIARSLLGTITNVDQLFDQFLRERTYVHNVVSGRRSRVASARRHF
jgi:hypothetical protein